MPVDTVGGSSACTEPFRFDTSYLQAIQQRKSTLPHSINDWKKFVSMNGMPYYFNSRLSVLTQDNMMDRDARSDLVEVIEEHIASIEEEYELPSDLEHVLSRWCTGDSDPDSEFSDEDSRHSSLNEDFSIHCISLELGARLDFRSNDRGDYVDYAAPQFLWQHLAEYSAHYRRIPIQLEVQFMCAMAHGATEQVIGTERGSFPFDDLQCKRIMQLYSILKARSEADHGTQFIPAVLWHIARIMEDVWHCRYRYHYGIVCRPKDDVPPESSRISRYFDFTMSCLLFARNKSFHRRLQATRPNGKVHIPEFRAFMEGIVSEWTDSNLLATVFVLASVGFLAIPDIGPVQRLWSLASALFGLTSVTSGIHHVWRHKRKIDAEHDDAHGYVSHISVFGSAMDLRLTACFLSLPIAALMWSVLSFMVALVSYCFQYYGEVGRILLAVLVAVVALCMMGAFLFFLYEMGGVASSDI